MLTAICHATGEGWRELTDLAPISDLIQRDDCVVWAHADIASLSPDDVATIQREFGLHELAVEDALNARQRPKLEPYETHLFAVMHQLETEDGQLEARQLGCFIGRRYVLTLHAGAKRTIDETLRRCRETQKPEEQGPSFVMHALLDVIVDDYQRIADELEDEIEEIEDTVLRAPRTRFDTQLYSLKQRLARLRRYVMPGERVLAMVVEPARLQMVTDRTAANFRDVHDHTLRVLDQVRNVEDLLDAVIELQRSEQTNALNEVTKRLTGWAAIIAVPTFIASVYGMNFRLVPDDGKRFGFYFALGLMAASGAGLYAFFRRKGWI